MAKGKYEDAASEQQKKRGAKTALHVIKNILVGLIVVVAIFMMIFTVVSVTVLDRDERSLFGYKAYIVLSDSMSATDFEAGDVVLIKEVDPATLLEGDIIAYRSQNAESYGEVVTHKIRQRTTDENGNPGFITYGTTTNADDEGVVTYSFILGKYQSRIPKVGTFFQFLKTTPGYIICILIPFLLLILLQGINCIQLFRQYKREQIEEIQKERKQVEAERAENRRMMEELQQLQQRLAQIDEEKADRPPDQTQPESVVSHREETESTSESQ